jgi:hypothetical protein
MATVKSPQGTSFKVSTKGFQVDTFPPYIASPVWPTAPYVPAPKFVTMPGNVRFVPEYDWGCPCQDEEDGYGAFGAASDKKKARLAKKADKLRAKAGKLETKAGVKPAGKAAGKEGVYKDGKKINVKKRAAETPAETPAEAPADEAAAAAAPAPEGVPQNAAEGASNMKLIIGGTIAVLVALGVAFAVKKKGQGGSSEAAAPQRAPFRVEAPAPPAYRAPAPAPASRAMDPQATINVPDPVSMPMPAPRQMMQQEAAVESDEMPITSNPRPLLRLMPVRSMRR